VVKTTSAAGQIAGCSSPSIDVVGGAVDGATVVAGTVVAGTVVAGSVIDVVVGDAVAGGVVAGSVVGTVDPVVADDDSSSPHETNATAATNASSTRTRWKALRVMTNTSDLSFAPARTGDRAEWHTLAP
jgi:hypothetical protein